MVEEKGTQNLDPEEGDEGTPKETPKPTPEKLILDKYKTQEELEKAYVERDKQAGQAVEKLRKLEQERETDLENIVGTKNTEIEQLKKQIAEINKPTPSGRYNPAEVKRYQDLVTAVAEGEEGATERLLDYNRGLAIYDRQMEDKQKSEVANKKATAQQWDKVKSDYGVEVIKEISSEIGTVLERYPDLRATAHENPDAMRDVVRLAEKMHEEKTQALKAEEELRDQEKAATQGGGPSGGGGVGEDESKMSLKRLEEKYGWNPDGGPIPGTPKE